MKILIQKFSSRKLWAAVVGIVTGLAMIFGLDQSIINTVSGAVVAIGSVVTYIVAEGRIDAAAVKAAIEAAEKAKDALTADKPQPAAPTAVFTGDPSGKRGDA